MVLLNPEIPAIIVDGYPSTPPRTPESHYADMRDITEFTPVPSPEVTRTLRFTSPDVSHSFSPDSSGSAVGGVGNNGGAPLQRARRTSEMSTLSTDYGHSYGGGRRDSFVSEEDAGAVVEAMQTSMWGGKCS